MERERRWIGATKIRADLARRFRLPRSKPAQQFLRLPFKLFQIRMLAHPARSRCSFHKSSFPLRPVSARSGRKEFFETGGAANLFRRTQSFPRTRRRPESARKNHNIPAGSRRGWNVPSQNGALLFPSDLVSSRVSVFSTRRVCLPVAKRGYERCTD